MDSHIHSKLVPREFYDHSFAVFRDPVSRIVSEYRYRAAGKANPKPFDDWVKAAFDRYGRDEYTFDNHIKPQADFVVPDTKLFRFEDGLAQVFDWVDEATGTEPADHGIWENRSAKLKVAVSDAIRGDIERFYAVDYRMIETWERQQEAEKRL